MRWLFLFAAMLLGCTQGAASAPVNVVVAEAVYGEAVERIGGANASVVSLMGNAAADPHDYEPTPSAARAIADAQIVIYNGLGYDWWVDRMLTASAARGRIAINVAALLGRSGGDNPHLWFDPLAMPALADALAGALSRLDPEHAAAYAERAKAYKAELLPLTARIAALRSEHSGTPVTATEPVLAYLADALSLDMRHAAFQRAVMNDTEPAVRDVAAIETDVRNRAVKVLFYNSQVKAPVIDRLLSLARDAGVPVVAVSETKPAGLTYVQWLQGVLDATDAALSGRPIKTTTR